MVPSQLIPDPVQHDDLNRVIDQDESQAKVCCAALLHKSPALVELDDDLLELFHALYLGRGRQRSVETPTTRPVSHDLEVDEASSEKSKDSTHCSAHCLHPSSPAPTS